MSSPRLVNDPRLLGAASNLALARHRRLPGPRVSEAFVLVDLEEAYQVQTVGLQLALSQGRSLSGVKAGLTSAVMRAALQVEEPVYGWLYADTARGSGAVIAWDSLLQPKVEIELALLLARDLPAGEISQAQMLASIAGAMLSLEINDSAIAGWQLTLLDAVADNLSSGLYVLGAQTVPLAHLQGKELVAELHKNGEPVKSNVVVSLTDCLSTAMWLVRKMGQLGKPLRAGDVLLTGALLPSVEIARGDRLRFQVPALGKVTCSFG